MLCKWRKSLTPWSGTVHQHSSTWPSSMDWIWLRYVTTVTGTLSAEGLCILRWVFRMHMWNSHTTMNSSSGNWSYLMWSSLSRAGPDCIRLDGCAGMVSTCKSYMSARIEISFRGCWCSGQGSIPPWISYLGTAWRGTSEHSAILNIRLHI